MKTELITPTCKLTIEKSANTFILSLREKHQAGYITTGVMLLTMADLMKFQQDLLMLIKQANLK